MSKDFGVGVLGIGVHLPAEIRTNDWWSPEVIASWQEPTRERRMPIPSELGDGPRLALAGMAKHKDDPFRGAIERRVAAEGVRASSLELAAAKQAIERSALAPDKIGALFAFSFPSDFLNAPNACFLHRELRLPERCFSLSVEAACHSFASQFTIARDMIMSGSIEVALLVQSWLGSRVVSPTERFAPWVGDGASAVVVGKVAAGQGLVAAAHSTDGRSFGTLVVGIPGKQWFEDGRVQAYSHEHDRELRMLLAAPDRARNVIRRALNDAGLRPQEIDFFACHQPFPWLQPVLKEYCDLDRAKTVDTFSHFASVNASNLPICLNLACEKGLLKKGERVLTFSAGAGETCGSLVIEW